MDVDSCARVEGPDGPLVAEALEADEIGEKRRRSAGGGDARSQVAKTLRTQGLPPPWTRDASRQDASGAGNAEGSGQVCAATGAAGEGGEGAGRGAAAEHGVVDGGDALSAQESANVKALHVILVCLILVFWGGG